MSLVARLAVAFVLGAGLMASTYQVLAQCAFDVVTRSYTCTGNVGSTNLDASAVDRTEFIFLDGTIGQFILVAGPSTYQTVDFRASLTGVTIDLSNQSGYQTIYTGLQIWFQNFNTIPNIIGSQGNDTLTGTAGGDSIVGNDGNDVINGGGGNDSLYGSEGDDIISGGSGHDSLEGYGGNDIINGNEGNDIIYGQLGDNTLNGGEGSDGLVVYTGTDNVDGGAGTDTVGFTIDISECTGDTITGVEVDLCNPSTPPVVVNPPPNPELCITDGTRVSVEDDTLLIFSDFRDTTNGMTITHIPLQSLRSPTDEEKAANVVVWLTYKASEFAPGWAAAVYWHANHYGVVVYKDGGKTIYEDTGAICGWF